MGFGFELSSELIEQICLANGRKFNPRYSYTYVDIPGGVAVWISDPNTGQKVDEFRAYSEQPAEYDYDADIKENILKMKKETTNTKQCINLIYAICAVSVVVAILVLLSFGG